VTNIVIEIEIDSYFWYYFVFELFRYRNAPTNKSLKILQKICSFAIWYAWFLLFTWESRQNIFEFSQRILPWMKFNVFWIALNIQIILLTTISATGFINGNRK